MNNLSIVIQSDNKILYSNSVDTKTDSLNQCKVVLVEATEKMRDGFIAIEKSTVGNNEIFIRLRYNKEPNEKIDECYDHVIVILHDKIHDKWLLVSTGKNALSMTHNKRVEAIWEEVKQILTTLWTDKFAEGKNV